jgi:hypothetical protein
LHTGLLNHNLKSVCCLQNFATTDMQAVIQLKAAYGQNKQSRLIRGT